MSSRYRRRTRGVDNKGRSKTEEKFVMLQHYLLKSDAYRSMKPLPRAVYTELKRRYNGRNNGEIFCSIRELVAELHCSKDGASAALRELEDKGFIRCARRGSFHYKVKHASLWVLTEERLGEEFPTKDFMRWKPQKENSGTAPRTAAPEKRTEGENQDRGNGNPVPISGPAIQKISSERS